MRRAILRDRPQVVALELPATLQRCLLAGRRAAAGDVGDFLPDEQRGRRRIYVPVEPADPFTEAIRTALEIGAEIVFADPDAGERPHLRDAYPDTYALRHIALEKYVEAYRVVRSRGRTGLRPRRGHRLEAAGRRSAGAGAGGRFAEPA